MAWHGVVPDQQVPVSSSGKKMPDSSPEARCENRRSPNNPVLKPGPKGSWNDARVLAPDVIVEPDGSLLMCAYGQSKQNINNNSSAGSIAFWRSE
jgi:hypothetical protein